MVRVRLVFKQYLGGFGCITCCNLRKSRTAIHYFFQYISHYKTILYRVPVYRLLATALLYRLLAMDSTW